MAHLTSFENMGEFNKGKASADRRSNSLKNLFGDLVGFGFVQSIEHGNSTPLREIRKSMTQWARPTGFTQKSLDEFVQTYCGFEWKGSRNDGSYVKIKDAEVQNLPADHCRFWDYERPERDAPEWSLDHACALLVKRALKNRPNQTSEMTEAQVIDQIRLSFAEQAK